jgi:uncharacterized protein (DUF1778 family)
MPSTSAARLDVRLTAELKKLIQEAATLSGRTVSDFAVATLADAAQRIIQQHSMTMLSDRDRDIFLKMLDADTKPNAALRRAAQHYRKHHAGMAD